MTGQTFADVRAEQDYEDRYLERLARFQSVLAASIAASDLLVGVGHLIHLAVPACARRFVAVHDGCA